MPTLGPKSSPTVALVEGISEALPDGAEWDERERVLLSMAADQAADIDRLGADIAERGVRVPGRGGEVLNQSFCEIRQARVALARILGQVDIPDTVSPAQLHGRKAAEARWRAS